MPPNSIQVIKQDEQEAYTLGPRIKIKEINEDTQFKIYKFNDKAMLLL